MVAACGAVVPVPKENEKVKPKQHWKLRIALVSGTERETSVYFFTT
jgi:hypothetical protein